MKRMTIIRTILMMIICVSILTGCYAKGGDETTTQEISSATSVAKSKQNVFSKATLSLSEAQLTSYSNKLYGWGMVKKEGTLPEVDLTQKDLLSKYSGYYCDFAANTNKQKVLYLTFDEGYENGNTSKILDVLKEKKVSAAFFITGPYLETQPDLVKRMAREGHMVGNHTIHHPSMPSITDNNALAQEMTELNAKYFELTHQNMTVMRPPRGEFSERTLAICQNLGYRTILWSFAYKDWETNNQIGEQNAYNAIVPYLHDGAILLLHAVSNDNAAVLGRVIDYATEQGYTFCSLDNLPK